MMGEEQERWLFNNLGRSKALWNVIAQQVMMANGIRRRVPSSV